MKTDRRMILFLVNTAFWTLSANFAHPITPTFIQELKLGDYMFGVAFSTMMAATFITSPFWGKLNGYISSRVSLMICCFGYGVGQLMFMMARTELDVTVARFVAGIFTGGIAVSTLTYIVNKSHPRDRTRVLTIQAAIQGIFSAFGYMIGGLLGEISTQFTFIIQVITLCLSGVLYLVICENDNIHKLKDISAKELVRSSNPFSAFTMGSKLIPPALFVLLVVAAVQYLGYLAYEQVFNYYIKDQFGFSPAYNGIIKGAIGFISLIANFTICVWIIRHTNVKKSLAYVFLACTVSLLPVIFLNSVVPFIVINIVYFAFNAILMPILQSLVAEESQGENSNLLMGCYNSIRSLGGIIGPLLAGAIYAVEPRGALIFTAVVYLIGVALSLAYCRLGAVKGSQNPA